jgi:hypothetical protein
MRNTCRGFTKPARPAISGNLLSSARAFHHATPIAKLVGGGQSGPTEEVTVNGFVRSVRSQKSHSFVSLGDGSSMVPLQAVVPANRADGYDPLDRVSGSFILLRISEQVGHWCSCPIDRRLGAVSGKRAEPRIASSGCSHWWSFGCQGLLDSSARILHESTTHILSRPSPSKRSTNRRSFCGRYRTSGLELHSTLRSFDCAHLPSRLWINTSEIMTLFRFTRRSLHHQTVKGQARYSR